MSKHDVAEVTLKLFGFYWLLLAALSTISLAMLPFGAIADEQQYWVPRLVGALFSVLWYGGVGLFIIKKCDFIIKHIGLRDDKEANDHRLAVDLNTLQAFLVALLGLYLVVVSVDDISSCVSSYLEQRQYHHLFHQPMNYGAYITSGVSAATKLLLAAALFFGRAVVVRTWTACRPLAKQITELRGKNIE